MRDARAAWLRLWRGATKWDRRLRISIAATIAVLISLRVVSNLLMT